VALSYDDAVSAGFKLRPSRFHPEDRHGERRRVGRPDPHPEMRIGGIVVRNVEAVVAPRGGLSTSLLGMSFLRRLGGFDLAKGRLILRA
jgi:aspartyl protease family protein